MNNETEYEPTKEELGKTIEMQRDEIEQLHSELEDARLQNQKLRLKQVLLSNRVCLMESRETRRLCNE